MDRMGLITQNIYDFCLGNHISCFVWETSPKADIYILHCFKNHHEEFKNFKAPGYIISLLHSSPPCVPSDCSDLVVTISKTQQRRVDKKSTLIYPGIKIPEISSFKRNSDVIKISRADPGKFHPEEKNIIDKIIVDKNINYTIICNEPKKVSDLLPCESTVVQNIGIKDIEKKNRLLRQHGIYADMHGDFEDTFCIALLEAMANGLACVVMRDDKNKVLDEVLGGTGIIVDNPKDFKMSLEILIDNPRLKEYFAKASYLRAKNNFRVERMITKWNELLIEKWYR